MPVLPMILLNGCAGIATGYRTLLPCHRVQDVINQLIGRLDNQPFSHMLPFYNNWTGIVEETEHEWRFLGRYTLKGTQCVITELPVHVGTERYKTNILHKLVEKHYISGLVEAHLDEDNVRFEFTVLPAFTVDIYQRVCPKNV